MLRSITDKKTAVCGVLMILAAALLLTVWPLRLWKEDVTLAGAGVQTGVSETVRAGSDVGENFTAAYGHLQTLSVYIDSVQAGGTVHLRLFGEKDGAQALLAEEAFAVQAGEGGYYQEISLDAETAQGQLCTYLLVTDDAAFAVGYEAADGGVAQGLLRAEDAPGYGSAFYHDTTVDGAAVMSRFTYRMALRKAGTALFAAAVVIAAALAVAAARLYYRRRPQKNNLLSLETVLRWTMTPLAVGVAAAAALAVGPLQLFDRRLGDILFYELGIALTLALCLYGLWHDRTGQPPLVSRALLRREGRGWVQSVLIALEIGFCCEYVNALYDLQHTLAERKMVIAFLLVILVTYSAAELWNLANLVFAVPAVIVALVYYRVYALDAAQKEYREHNLALRLLLAALILLGLVVINTVRLLMTDLQRRRQGRRNAGEAVGSPARRGDAQGADGLRLHRGDASGAAGSRAFREYASEAGGSRLHRGYAAALAVLFLLMTAFRNTRWWPVVLALLFTLFYVRYFHWSGRSLWLLTICRGVALQFAAMVVYCLLHRYYLAFRYTRFPMDFHTVTTTALYLTVVEAAALVLFLEKWVRSGEAPDGAAAVCGKAARRFSAADGAEQAARDARHGGRLMAFWRQRGAARLAAVWKEAVFLGVASSYLLMTMSRTGVAAVAATALVLVIALAAAGGASAPARAAAMVLAMTLATLAAFPMVFTAQRIVPTVVGAPKLFEIETYPDEVMRNRHWASMYYICLERFGQVFGAKMFGLPEGSYDFYGDWKESASAAVEASLTKETVLAAAEKTLAEEAAADMGWLLTENTSGAATLSVRDGGPLLASAAETAPFAAASDTAAAAEPEALQTVASAETAPLPDEPQDGGGDYSNGRLSIYKSYLQQLNLFGHREMGATLEDGSIAVHAHNTYLQVAYDHGILTGVWFALFLLLTFIRACVYYRKKTKSACALLPLAAVVAFGMAGVVEWVFTLCNPMTVLLLYAVAPLLRRERGETKLHSAAVER